MSALSEFTYTSGPWQPFIGTEGNYVVASFDPPMDLAQGECDPIAEIFPREDDPDGNNLNVIAAAPRLLLAAEEAIPVLVALAECPMSIALSVELTGVLHQLRLAVGAARGEQP